VNDVSFNMVGTIWAVAGILSTSFYQIFIKTKQDALKANSWQLLKYQAPQASLVVAIITPVFDKIQGKDGLIAYMSTIKFQAAMVLLFSCLLAFCVNLSIYLVVGRTSPVAYNVLGHFKLLVILAGGVMFLNGDKSPIVLLGMSLAFIGITAYTHLKQSITDSWKQKAQQEKILAESKQGGGGGDLEKEGGDTKNEHQVLLESVMTSSQTRTMVITIVLCVVCLVAYLYAERSNTM